MIKGTNLRQVKAAAALHSTYYNFCRVHRTLRCTPAMEAGITTREWDLGDLIDAAEGKWILPTPSPREALKASA